MATENVPGDGLMRTLDDWARRADAVVAIGRHVDGAREGEWTIMANFGEESPGSPMAAGSLIGADESLPKAVEQALRDARVNPCAACGWEQTCEEGCHS